MQQKKLCKQQISCTFFEDIRRNYAQQNSGADIANARSCWYPANQMSFHQRPIQFSAKKRST